MSTVDIMTAVRWENTHEGKDFSRFSLSSKVTRFDKLNGEIERDETECQMVRVTSVGRVRGSSICTISTWPKTVCVNMC